MLLALRSWQFVDEWQTSSHVFSKLTHFQTQISLQHLHCDISSASNDYRVWNCDRWVVQRVFFFISLFVDCVKVGHCLRTSSRSRSTTEKYFLSGEITTAYKSRRFLCDVRFFLSPELVLDCICACMRSTCVHPNTHQTFFDQLSHIHEMLL